MMALRDSARLASARVLTEANRANFHRDWAAAPPAQLSLPSPGMGPHSLKGTSARSSSQTSTASREQ